MYFQNYTDTPLLRSRDLFGYLGSINIWPLRDRKQKDSFAT
jgi:hypothetical protein